MHSGAGHDSQVMAGRSNIAMIFVQSKDGRSHTPEEFTSVEDAVAAYINSVPTGGVVFVSGIVHAAFALPGVETVLVTSPADDVAATGTEKPVAGVIDVVEWIWS